MKNSTSLMVGIVVAVALLSVAVIVVPIEQSAQDISFSFEQNRRTNVVALQAVVIAVQ